MNVEEHTEHLLAKGHVLFEVVADDLDFMYPPMLQCILIVIRKEMSVHIFPL